MFEFSPRPGTQAADMQDLFVPVDVVRDRFAKLKVVVDRSALAKHEQRIGRIEEIIVEGPSKRDPSRVSGRTRQNKLVHVPNAPGLVEGAIANVEVVSAAPYHMVAQLVDIVDSPRHRRRIPVSST
jgi:tRNA-2-methylthio-N6-dimethylallyladenosine synthase